mgnify:CR=1 FL=1
MLAALKECRDKRDFIGMRYIFLDSLDVDPTFEKYQEDYELCKRMSGLFEKHVELHELILDKKGWTKNYWNQLKSDLKKNFSQERFEHMIEVAQVVYADKVKRLLEEREQREQKKVTLSQETVKSETIDKKKRSEEDLEEDPEEAQKRKIEKKKREFAKKQKAKEEEIKRREKKVINSTESVTNDGRREKQPKKVLGVVVIILMIVLVGIMVKMVQDHNPKMNIKQYIITTGEEGMS